VQFINKSFSNVPELIIFSLTT